MTLRGSSTGVCGVGACADGATGTSANQAQNRGTAVAKTGSMWDRIRLAPSIRRLLRPTVDHSIMMRFSIASLVVLSLSQQPAPQPAQPPAQTPPPAPPQSAAAAETAKATQEDHRQMLEQLGIKRLRPGPSGNEQQPNHANYDEALANPYPNLPEVLTLNNGRKVTSADMWRRQRRPEIVEAFEREVIGRVPKHVPPVTWAVTQTLRAEVAGRPVIGRRLVGRVDNSSFPS